MNYVDKIVERFGGVKPMARMIEKPAPTIQSWRRSGSIPDRYKPEILRIGNGAGLDLSTDDFFPH